MQLGILRVLGVYWFLQIAVSVCLLGFASHDQVVLFNAENAIFLMKTVFNAVALWLLLGRKAALRMWCVVGGLVLFLVASVVVEVSGGFGRYSGFGRTLYFLVVAAVFLVSSRAASSLTQPLEQGACTSSSVLQIRSWQLWRKLIIYFCAFSVVGHWAEAGYGLLIKWGVVAGTYDPSSQIWSDWLYPFCVYGVGAVVCVLLFMPLRRLFLRKTGSVVASAVCCFVVSAFVCAGIELAMGLLLNQPSPQGVKPLWDYSDIPFNFMGQICLQNAIAFGCAATFMTWVVLPVLDRAISKLPHDAANALFVVVVTLFLMLFFLYCVEWRLM